MNFLDGINNTLRFINDNWTGILIMIGLAVGVYTKIRDYAKKSTEEKIEIAKAHIREAMLKMITDAELDYEEWHLAGSVKRSQVIKQIFDQYPILGKVIDQDALIEWIDGEIDCSLATLRGIVDENDAKA